jgi:glycopeptide antibiotics resistance protein
MGLSLEILQSFTGFRQADIFDMVANTIGVGIGLFIGRFALGWSTRRLTP